MGSGRVLRGLGAAVALAAALAAGPARAEDLPQWPHEQQEMLRETEAQVLKLQRQLSAARRNNDAASVAELSQQFKALQEKRRKLIVLTRDQLPSE